MYQRLAIFLVLLPVGAEAKPWTVEDVIYRETATDFQISPDQKWALFVKEVPDKKQQKHVAHLFRLSLTGERETQITRGRHSCSHPRWSPHGNRVAFLTDRPVPDKDKGKQQIWLIDPTGGEPWRLTDYPRSVINFAWAGSEHIVFAAQEKPALREATLEKEKKDPSRVVDDEKNAPPVRLFRIALKSKKVTRLTQNKDRIQSMALSPDGEKAVAIHEQSLRFEYDHQIKPKVFLHDLKTGKSRQIFQAKKHNIGEVQWTPNGNGFYATSAFTTDPRYLNATVTHLYYYDLASGTEQQVELNWSRGLARQTEHGDKAGFLALENGIIALLANGARNKVARYRRVDGQWKRAWVKGAQADHLYGFRISKKGSTFLYAVSKASLPTQWYRCRLDGPELKDPVRLTKLHSRYKGKPFARTELVRWAGAKEEEVEGILYYPHGYERGKRYPLIVMIHGGPFGADYDSWEETWAYPANLMCQKGAFVFKPNYHGSSNYGLPWAESIAKGKYYEYPLKDIETGVDALIARGLVDAKRMATMGWSNGAILSSALIASTPRYKAASAGAGGAEWVSDWGVCSIGASFSNYYFGRTPLEDPKLYIKMAPLYQFHKVTTPTILFQGEEDRVVPPHHAWLQYRALQHLGKAPTRLVLFPKEKHSLKNFAHQRRKLEEELQWFDRYLFDKAIASNPSLKKGSPLSRLLVLNKAKRHNGIYGDAKNGLLVPETVPWKRRRVGRFEVTLSQYDLFNKTPAKIPVGREDLPAYGVSFERAKAYCEWLSKKTGETYRLPTEEEAKELYKMREGRECTLDFWAGYKPNPEDAARLLKETRVLPGAAPLVQKVGQFSSYQGMFDLGGNVAEWVTTKNGKGKLVGGCAVLPLDSGRAMVVPLHYRGFRVVQEIKGE